MNCSCLLCCCKESEQNIDPNQCDDLKNDNKQERIIPKRQINKFSESSKCSKDSIDRVPPIWGSNLLNTLHEPRKINANVSPSFKQKITSQTIISNKLKSLSTKLLDGNISQTSISRKTIRNEISPQTSIYKERLEKKTLSQMSIYKKPPSQTSIYEKVSENKTLCQTTIHKIESNEIQPSLSLSEIKSDEKINKTSISTIISDDKILSATFLHRKNTSKMLTSSRIDSDEKISHLSDQISHFSIRKKGGSDVLIKQSKMNLSSNPSYYRNYSSFLIEEQFSLSSDNSIYNEQEIRELKCKITKIQQQIIKKLQYNRCSEDERDIFDLRRKSQNKIKRKNLYARRYNVIQYDASE